MVADPGHAVRGLPGVSRNIPRRLNRNPQFRSPLAVERKAERKMGFWFIAEVRACG